MAGRRDVLDAFDRLVARPAESGRVDEACRVSRAQDPFLR
jgi:hypothetical protein